MQDTAVALNFEIFTVLSSGDNDVMCFNSMNKSTLRVIVSEALSFTVPLKQASTELQNDIRMAARLNIDLNNLIIEIDHTSERYELSGKNNTNLLVKLRKLEGQADMLAADIVKLEDEIIIPNLNSIGVHIEEFDNDKNGIDLNIYYTDEHGISCIKRCMK